MTAHLLANEVELAARAGPGRLAPDRRAHYEQCVACQAKVFEADRAFEEPTRRERVPDATPVREKVTPAPAAAALPPAPPEPERDGENTQLESNEPPKAPPPAPARPAPASPPAPAPAPPAPAPVPLAAAPVLPSASLPGVPAVSADGEPSQVLPRGASVGRYIVLGTLGQGGMGVVYAAYDNELDRKVAIKLLHADAEGEGQARLLREAQAMARVSHPNIVAVYDVGTLQDRVFVAMEFVDGVTLRRKIKDGQMGWRETLDLFLLAGKGLAAAHAAGLVHRDFKPENVMVGKDGRVYVMDFGLAKLAGEAISAAAPSKARMRDSSRSIQLLSPLTQEGLVMGTPHYMAPEQHQGRPPDTRTDQFSFCAALYWALWKKRPFDPQKMSDLAAESEDLPTSPLPVKAKLVRRPEWSQIIADPPSRPRVPLWLRRAVLRGMSFHPADRYPSMEALLRVLERHPVRQRNQLIAAGTALLVTGAAFAAYRQQQSQSELCTGAPKLLAGAWDRQVRSTVEKAFKATGAIDGAAQFQRSADALDAYAQQWATMHRESCEATRIRKEQTENVLSLRMLCLDRRLRELRGLTGLLAAADEKLVSNALDAVLQLPNVHQCADVTALSERVPLPSDPAAQQEIRELGEQIAQSNALRYAGRYKDALSGAQRTAEKAKETHFRPLEAEALYVEGVLLDRTGKLKEGQGALIASINAADAGRDDTIRAQAAIQLLYMAGKELRIEDGYRWADAAKAAIERIGGNRELEAWLLGNLGALYLNEGKNDQAVDAYRRALQLTELEFGKDNPKRANYLANLGAAEAGANRPDRAVIVLEDAIAAMEKIRGPEHPLLTGPLWSLARAHMTLGQFDQAHTNLARGMTITRARYGANNPRVANFLDLEGTIFQEEKRYHEALGAFQASLEIKQKALPADSPDLSFSYDGIGQALLGLGKPKDAVPMLERALKLSGPDPAAQAETRFGLAKALWEIGREKARAKELAGIARADFEKAKQVEKAEEISKWISSR